MSETKHYKKLPHCFWMETEENTDFQTVISFTKVPSMPGIYHFEAFKPNGVTTGTLVCGGIIHSSWKKISKQEFEKLKFTCESKSSITQPG